MNAELSARQRATLRALCDTFIPPTADATDGTGAPLHARAEWLFTGIEDPRARAKVRLLLGLLDSRIVNLALSGDPRPFTGMDTDARIRLLMMMGASGMQLRRAGFQALKRMVSASYYGWPATDSTHPAWRTAGYPGPLPHRPGEPNEPLPVLAVDHDTTLDCDVVIVGSGAGGGVAAGVLAEAGRNVVVLEKGEQQLPRDFSHYEGDGLTRNYLDKGLLMTESGSMPILAGSGLGGGTVINYTTSFVLPDATREEWNRLSGLTLFTSPRLNESFERVRARLSVNENYSQPGRRDQILEAGCKAMGWHWGVIPRNVRGCPGQVECGYCGFGCRHGAKQSTTVTYLADAARNGARLVVRCTADRVLMENGRAAGVAARVQRADGSRVSLTVRAKVVIAAAGAIHTPALLTRSAVSSPMIGRNLHLHPGTAVAAFFDERVESWIGHQQTRYSDQFANQHDGYGAKFETVPLAFALPATAFGWEGPRAHRAMMDRVAHIGIVGILLRDRDAGRVVTGKDGRPRVHYELSAHDRAHVRTAMRGAAELLASQGAREIFTIQQPPARTSPGAAGWLDNFMAAADAHGYDRCRQSYITFHQMASCRMGSRPRDAVASETGECFALPGLYIADGSAFVTSSGVNPMLTIMAIADHVARGIAERW